MGIFDLFSDQPAKDAAAAQIAGLNAGNTQATGNINQAIGALGTNYGAANTALQQNYGAANTALTGNFGAGIGALQQGYGSGINALQGNYTSALAPYLQNFSQAQGGVTQLGNVLGLNGPGGSDAAMKALENTPGFQFQKQQGDAAITAADAASGKTASGNEALALSNYNQGLAGTTYNNYVSQLQPFLGASNAAAGGISNAYTGLGSSLGSAYTGLGKDTASAYGGLGAGLANTYTGLGNATAGVNTGLGNAVAGQQDQLAGLNFNTQTGIGNANANADLAAYNASGNFWNMLGGLGGMKTSGGGTVGGNAVSGLGNLASGAGSALMSMFSDERLKEDIEPVGELYDGTNIYRYRYIGDPTPRIGVMAQEVEKTNPGAVVEIGGYKAVDYGRATQYASELARFLEAA
jgi:hypothetical protein